MMSRITDFRQSKEMVVRIRFSTVSASIATKRAARFLNSLRETMARNKKTGANGSRFSF